MLPCFQRSVRYVSDGNVPKCSKWSLVGGRIPGVWYWGGLYVRSIRSPALSAMKNSSAQGRCRKEMKGVRM